MNISEPSKFNLFEKREELLKIGMKLSKNDLARVDKEQSKSLTEIFKTLRNPELANEEIDSGRYASLKSALEEAGNKPSEKNRRLTGIFRNIHSPWSRESKLYNSIKKTANFEEKNLKKEQRIVNALVDHILNENYKEILGNTDILWPTKDSLKKEISAKIAELHSKGIPITDEEVNKIKENYRLVNDIVNQIIKKDFKKDLKALNKLWPTKESLRELVSSQIAERRKNGIEITDVEILKIKKQASWDYSGFGTI